MNFEGNQNRFINSKHLGVQVIKGSLHTGKTSAALYRTMNLKNNYCLYESDKIVFVSNDYRNKISAKSFYDSTVKKIKTSNITLFSLMENDIEFLSLNELVDVFFNKYISDNKLSLDEISEADKISLLKEVLSINENGINKIKTLKNSSVYFLLDEIQWIKASLLSKEEYMEVNRRGRGKPIRKNSIVRELLYKMYIEYKEMMIHKRLIDKYDKVELAKAMVAESNNRYIHIFLDNCESLTRSELNFIRSFYDKKDYSSFTYLINSIDVTERHAWLKNGIKLNYLDDIEVSKNFRFTSVANKKANEYSLEKFKYINLKHRSEHLFLIDGASTKPEVIIDWNAKQEVIKEDDLVEVPMYSDIAAGEPIPMNGEQESNFYIPYNWIRGKKDNFILHVKGDSMINANINDGDFVVIRRQQSADHNDIVAAEIEGSATLKRLNLKDKTPYLMPENPKYQPISLENKEASILGVAIGVIKQI
jgi:SOS regulatory protein LexA